MKRVMIYFWFMIKRMGKHPVYWLLLFIFPLVIVFVTYFNKEASETQIAVGYVAEEQSGKTAQERTLLEQLENKLQKNEKEHLLFYEKCENTDELEKKIITGELSCGTVFGKDFTEKIIGQDYYHSITILLPEGMNVSGIVQEDLFRIVYQVYSAVWYADALEERGYSVRAEEVLGKFKEYQAQGKVFAVEYDKVSGDMLSREYASAGEPIVAGGYKYAPAGDSAAADDYGQQAEGGGYKENLSLISLRGVLAFLVLIAATLGALDACRDRERGTAKGIPCPIGLTMVTVGAPILFGVIFLAGGMIWLGATGGSLNLPDTAAAGAALPGMTAAGGFGNIFLILFLRETCRALLYGIVLWLLAMISCKLFSEKLLTGILPCYLLLTILCCPIFFDLGQTIPIIGYLSKLFPVTWYMG